MKYRADYRNALKEPDGYYDRQREERKRLWKARAENPVPWKWKWKRTVPRPTE